MHGFALSERALTSHSLKGGKWLGLVDALIVDCRSVVKTEATLFLGFEADKKVSRYRDYSRTITAWNYVIIMRKMLFDMLYNLDLIYTCRTLCL